MRILLIVFLLPLMASTCKDYQPCVYSDVTFINESAHLKCKSYRLKGA